MTEPDLIARQRTLLRDLLRLAGDRARAAPDAERNYRAEKAAIVLEFEESFQTAIVRFATDKESTEREHREAREAAQHDFAIEKESSQREFGAARQKITHQRGEEKETAHTTFNETRWSLSAMFEAAQEQADERLKSIQAKVESQMRKLSRIHDESLVQMQRWKYEPDPVEFEDKGPKRAAEHRKLSRCIRAAKRQLAHLEGLTVPRWVHGWRLPLLFLALGAVAIAPLLLIGVPWFYAVPGCLSTAVVIAFLVRWLLTVVARSQIRDAYRPLAKARHDAQASRRKILSHYEVKREKKVADMKRRHDRALKKAVRSYKVLRADIRKRRAEELTAAQTRFRQRKAANNKRLKTETRDAEESFTRRMAEIQQRFDHRSIQVHDRRDRKLAELNTRHDQLVTMLTTGWQDAVAHARTAAAEIHREGRTLFPDWSDPTWSDRVPPTVPPPCLRLGEFRVHIAAADDPAGPVDFRLPALTAFPQSGSLLLHSVDDGRVKAVEALQAMMYRLLTALPPGKVRFTILDPAGLGENFAAFMNLADHDESLVGSRIWTEAAHIEQRLTDMTAHMENVIQKYLRNQYKDINEYNAQAGEVAEPFRFVVAANFPAGFTPEAARRLTTLAQTGARCGVFTLVSVDGRLPMPQGFDLNDLAHASVVLRWQDKRFSWNDFDFGRFPLTLDQPPLNEVGLSLLHDVGARAKEASRVEVPFEFIAPPPEQWWTGDSRGGVTVPLGRAGATKRQALVLGKGTSQHVLVAGKTGSGKSTLLHALIANLALTYSPDEVELYLIDFKKGVEFKTYAAHALPHARVVAIESEREFGLSVLQRLDQELKVRGERFRDAGVQDIAGYRNLPEPGASATGFNGPVADALGSEKRMPRILLVVDEFQEFFVEDDRLAQDAAQLLDRLVRQGRAFGLHILLGSQTLGGAYSLARSTIDQMAVRIALQCSEADAHLILSDDNSAARLLSRPGEAIYNDANGLVEGNNPFQVVWLPDAKREEYLMRVRDLAEQRLPQVPTPLVFEGNLPADAIKNIHLNRMLEEPAWPTPLPRSHVAWLGDSVAIKDPTAATFRRQGGSNLLIVGQQDEAALGMTATAVVSLAAQRPDAVFCLLDGSPADAAHTGFLHRLAEVLPQRAHFSGWRDLPKVIAEAAAEVERRQQNADGEALPPWYLVIYGLQRFRDLRKAEDDFSFSRRADEPPSPAAQLGTILKEGSSLGVHTLIWCDTLNNANRSLDRAMMREFEMRVLFQMSVADSSNLIDTPAAGKLGLHRALFHSEEQGRAEKFRPYGLPSAEWLAMVRRNLAGRQPQSPEVVAR